MLQLLLHPPIPPVINTCSVIQASVVPKVCATNFFTATAFKLVQYLAVIK